MVETAIIGTSIGAAMTGMRPVAEIMFTSFLGTCMDEIYNQAAKIKYMTGGKAKVPLTIRTSYGGGICAAAQHSERNEAWFVHTPGIKVVLPSTPYDAKGLLKASIRDDNPVLFEEHKMLYRMRGEVPEEEYVIPLGEADVKREGSDATIVATALMVHRALQAAEKLKGDGIEVEIVDPRTLSPLDKKTIIKSVQKTGRAIVVSEDSKTCGITAEVAAIIAEEGFDYLDAPVKRVAAPDVPMPFSPVMEKWCMPDENRIIDAVKSIVK
jgi:pyruvate dehydrogenase E1 component beta subunit